MISRRHDDIDRRLSFFVTSAVIEREGRLRLLDAKRFAVLNKEKFHVCLYNESRSLVQPKEERHEFIRAMKLANTLKVNSS